MDELVGTIVAFAGNFVPRGWRECNGDTILINGAGSLPSLYKVIGSTYGGDNITNFKLPDLQGKVIIGAGVDKSSGILRKIGETYGQNTLTLQTDNLPSHNHSFNVTNGQADNTSPEGKMLGIWSGGVQYPDGFGGFSGSSVDGKNFTSNNNNLVILNQETIGITGNASPINTEQASLVCKYIICCEGIYPSNRRILDFDNSGKEIPELKTRVYSQVVGSSTTKKKIIEIALPFNKEIYEVKSLQFTFQTITGYDDAFAATIISEGKEVYKVSVCRIDGEMWGQDLVIVVYFNYYEK